MPVKSLDLIIPDTAPFDKHENWFESFVGRHIRPVVASSTLKRFWFSRYGQVGAGKSIRFRFEFDDLSLVQSEIDQLLKIFPVGNSGYADYDYASDIGEGEGSRFLGVNGRHQDKGLRGELAFDFLHASARLFLDCLAGPDSAGYFKKEPETSSGFSVETSLEQFHHLFCNMTAVPTFVVEAEHPLYGKHLLSLITFAMLQGQDPTWQGIRREKVNF